MRERVNLGASGMFIPAINPDGSQFPIEKMLAHRTGQKHLAVSVFVLCGDQLLIQKRAAAKYHCGGLWANTCCTHPHWRERPLATAVRRLRQEVGLELPLVERAVIDYHAAVTDDLFENERVHVFEGKLARPILPTGFDPDEVAALRWLSREELSAEIASEPWRFTPWLRIYMERWAELSLRATG